MSTGSDKVTWRCVSKRLLSEQCDLNCEVEAEFEPRGCLLIAAWQLWQKVEENQTESSESET